MDSFLIFFIVNGIFLVSFFFTNNIYIPLILSAFSLFAILFFLQPKKTTINSYKITDINFTKDQYIIITTCLIIFVILEKFIGFDGALFTSFIIFLLLTKSDSRICFFIAFMLLFITAMISAVGNTKTAEGIAILTYYFFVIGIIWDFIDYLRELIAKKTVH